MTLEKILILSFLLAFALMLFFLKSSAKASLSSRDLDNI